MIAPPPALAPPAPGCDTAPVEQPRLSVVIPAHNAAATLARAIRSVQAQQPPPDEIIVVDDASSDASVAIAQRCGITPLRLATRQGAAAARNQGVRAARGAVIGFLDADDEWLPGKLAAQLPLLAEASFVACDARLFAADGAPLGPLFGGARPRPGPACWQGLLAHNTIATSCVLVWRAAFDAVGGFDPALPVAEDQDLWLRLARAGRLGYREATLVHMHQTATSLSGVGSARGAREQLCITLPMLERHIQAHRDCLSAAQIRRIRAARWLQIGRGACWTGAWSEGARLILAAMLRGHRPLEGLRILLATAPPLRRLRGG